MRWRGMLATDVSARRGVLDKTANRIVLLDKRRIASD